MTFQRRAQLRLERLEKRELLSASGIDTLPMLMVPEPEGPQPAAQVRELQQESSAKFAELFEYMKYAGSISAKQVSNSALHDNPRKVSVQFPLIANSRAVNQSPFKSQFPSQRIVQDRVKAVLTLLQYLQTSSAFDTENVMKDLEQMMYELRNESIELPANAEDELRRLRERKEKPAQPERDIAVAELAWGTDSVKRETKSAMSDAAVESVAKARQSKGFFNNGAMTLNTDGELVPLVATRQQPMEEPVREQAKGIDTLFAGMAVAGMQFADKRKRTTSPSTRPELEKSTEPGFFKRVWNTLLRRK